MNPRSDRDEIPQGLLDLLILRTLMREKELHGFEIAQQIERTSEDVLQVEEGSLYPARHRMDEAGWVKSEWGTSENNRRARYYHITKAGRRHLAELEGDWAAHVEAVKRVLKHA